ncbi:MDR family MFS transporter [Ureibacillus manganicus]|uniref:Multidrug MFS transporter n=1 Tax=Ureibacillus manganicus DSM 26584 TaxID=1384049 RepID=A0A0A3IIQ8_9BACL|nr:MFS transporter [Ureibacillus manganicus]KGR74742.1 multidrug MFS transporter [Ureibacillus manganicus DSM 26584]
MPKSIWLLVIGMLVNNIGNSLIWPINSIYIHDHLGQTLTVAGLILMINSGAGVLGSLIGGFLFDRIGGYKSIMLGISITIFALTGLTIWHGWPHYVIFLTIMGFGSGIVFPSMFAMVGVLWPEGGRRGFNTMYIAQNVGVAIGPALAGPIAEFSFTYIFMSNLVMYIVFFLIAFFGYRNLEASAASRDKREKSNGVEEGKTKDRSPFYSLLIVSSVFLLATIAYSQWASTMPSHMQGLGISLREYGLVWTINGLLIITLQPLASPLLNRYEHKIKSQLVVGVMIMMLSFVVIQFAEEFTIFAVAMIIITIGEILVWPAIPAIANRLAPKGLEGMYQGVVTSAGSIGRMIGPFFGGIMVDQFNMEILLWVLCIIFIIAIIPCLLYDWPLKKANKTQKY